jgi:hypothetical protein
MHLEPNRPGKRQYRTRMLWYYERIIDLMLANPDVRIQDIAAAVRKAPSTISMIINSDMFKAAYNQRRAQFTQAHDLALLSKTQKLANASLDSILAVIEKKKDTIPLSQLMELNGRAMDRLGYGVPKDGNLGGVTVNVGGQTNVTLPPAVTREQLEEARMAVRQTQAMRLLPAPAELPPEADVPEQPVSSLEEPRVERSGEEAVPDSVEDDNVA